MEIRQLRYAVLLEEHRHFGRAAQAAFITQSAFSQQIAQLERGLGVRLFDRDRRGVRPTAAGLRLLEHAHAVLGGLSALEADVRAMARGHTGALRIGIFGAGAGELTPLLIDAFRSAVPGVDLVFRELSMVQQFEHLRDGDVDVALVHPLCDSEEAEFTVLFDEPRLAAVPAHHDLARVGTIRLDDLVNEPFVVASKGVPARWRSFWACSESSVEPGASATEMQTIAEGLAAVAYRRVVDTVPASSTRYHRHPGVVFVPIADASFASMAVARRAGDRRFAVEAFCHLADRVAAEHHAIVPGAVRAG